jgi:hypothetical protein
MSAVYQTYLNRNGCSLNFSLNSYFVFFTTLHYTLISALLSQIPWDRTGFHHLVRSQSALRMNLVTVIRHAIYSTVPYRDLVDTYSMIGLDRALFFIVVGKQ